MYKAAHKYIVDKAFYDWLKASIKEAKKEENVAFKAWREGQDEAYEEHIKWLEHRRTLEMIRDMLKPL